MIMLSDPEVAFVIIPVAVDQVVATPADFSRRPRVVQIFVENPTRYMVMLTEPLVGEFVARTLLRPPEKLIALVTDRRGVLTVAITVSWVSMVALSLARTQLLDTQGLAAVDVRVVRSL